MFQSEEAMNFLQGRGFELQRIPPATHDNGEYLPPILANAENPEHEEFDPEEESKVETAARYNFEEIKNMEIDEVPFMPNAHHNEADRERHDTPVHSPLG